ncbi:tubulin nucleotide-binding domain-like protein [Anaeromyces robustus]|uniref:Tubulin nucleotide-binding domain-like protein n=1 Tax=Anaeromyces robustus TaxID=1754192 RepID=A0A1Y1XIY9_9FUNG|nr:tubulin nucleotide-binding domain-like protein [Anaeromyces robustus]|eukprot:ORX85727.1 tubulin nucleotide-binding domain-like protein [Anaeromyces robustus]
MREIITIQLGSTANYVGTHFWNSLENSINKIKEESKEVSNSNSHNDNNEEDYRDINVFYKMGISPKREEIYSPRLLIMELKGGINSIKNSNPFYQPPVDFDTLKDNASQLWPGKIETYKSELDEKSSFQKTIENPNFEYQKLFNSRYNSKSLELNEKTIKSWTDFNISYYHPQTTVELSEYNVNDESTPFGSFSCGEELYNSGYYGEKLFDENLRFFLEDCDQLQGFQVFCETNSAFGGFASKLIEEINDEFGRHTVLIYGVENKEDNTILSRINKSLCMNAFNESSLLYIPLDISNTNANNFWSKYYSANVNSLYHSTALYSSVIESISLPFSSANNYRSMSDICSTLITESIKLGGISFKYPCKNTENCDLLRLYYYESMSNMENIFGQQYIYQGMDEIQEFYDKYKCFRTSSWLTKDKYNISPTFPQIFNANELENINYFKFNEQDDPNKEPIMTDIVTDIPMMTRLACDSSLNFIVNQSYKCLDGYRSLVEKETGYEEDDILELRENLKRLRDSIGAEDENL